ncbi:SGNH/GDSL hydrolase family protein [Opitutaceae bacterium TAV4]|nr:SGNH/GDSL hydrolase family protein [Opitutaceae bacterium TAV4]RRK02834.1 SGNH/GDSL hydrolase family protein [Opitutaceae bacterium TAV3]
MLCIGDSITRHGASERTRTNLGWNHVAGMAASAEENDYAHRLARLVQTALPDRRVELHFHIGGGSGKASQRLAAIDTVLPLKPHLVVVQLGEHEKESDGIESLKTNYEQLLTAFDRQTPHRPLVIATGTWSLGKQEPLPAKSATADAWRYTGWPATVDRVMADICLKHGIPFVPVNDLARNPANRGWGTSPGVKWHPNDNGHAGYAQKIFTAWQAATADIVPAKQGHTKTAATDRP